MTRENIKPKPGLKSELGPCPAADWTQKVIQFENFGEKFCCE